MAASLKSAKQLNKAFLPAFLGLDEQDFKHSPKDKRVLVAPQCFFGYWLTEGWRELKVIVKLDGIFCFLVALLLFSSHSCDFSF